MPFGHRRSRGEDSSGRYRRILSYFIYLERLLFAIQPLRWADEFTAVQIDLLAQSTVSVLLWILPSVSMRTKPTRSKMGLIA